MKNLTKHNTTKKAVAGVLATAVIMGSMCMTSLAAETETQPQAMHFNSVNEVIASWESHAPSLDFENESFNFTVEMNNYDEVDQFKDYYESKCQQMAANNSYSLTDYYLYATDTRISTGCELNEDGETYTGKCDFCFKTDVHGTINDFIAARNEAANIASQWAGLDDYNKVISIIKWLCNNTKYDYDSINQGIERGHAIGNCIFDRCCVCDSNAQAFQAMAESIGLTSVIMNGEIRGEGHAWNAVCIDGAWYLVDPTVANQPDFIDLRRVLFGTQSTDVAANEYEYVTTLPLSTTDYPAPVAE